MGKNWGGFAHFVTYVLTNQYIFEEKSKSWEGSDKIWSQIDGQIVVWVQNFLYKQ